jgi:predicted glycoside hydrolase/deacetylase ChbG (UPF0249 family)
MAVHAFKAGSLLLTHRKAFRSTIGGNVTEMDRSVMVHTDDGIQAGYQARRHIPSLTHPDGSGTNTAFSVPGDMGFRHPPVMFIWEAFVDTETRGCRHALWTGALDTRSEMKVLIINADDLGYTEGINTGIAQCFQEGMVRSATLMANGEAFEHAVKMAKKNQGLGIGIHLVLTGMRPLARESDVPGLLDKDGLLPSTPFALLLLLLSGKVTRQAVWNELNQQVSRVFDAGLVPTHLDSHKHVHLLPQILEVLVDLCTRYSIKWIRRPFESQGLFPMLARVDKGHRAVLLKQYGDSRLTVPLRHQFRRTVLRAGLRMPDHFFGLSMTGIWNQASAAYLMQALPPGVSEWMVHPGVCDRALCSGRTRLREQREREKDILCSPFLMECAEKNGIFLKAFDEQIA